MNRLMMILSGGQDSTIALYMAKNHFDEIHAITFDYGQKHRIELEASKKIAELACVRSHNIIDVSGILKSSSPLTTHCEVEEYQDYKSMVDQVGQRVENTFVPMRNTLFAVIAANRAFALRCNYIGLGVCENDSANYPDCTGSYISALQSCITKSLSSGFERYLDIYAPLLHIDKVEAIKAAHGMSECWAALAYTHTSYDGDYPPVNKNHANLLRAESFRKAELPDPLILRAVKEGLMDLPETENYKGI